MLETVNAQITNGPEKDVELLSDSAILPVSTRVQTQAQTPALIKALMLATNAFQMPSETLKALVLVVLITIQMKLPTSHTLIVVSTSVPASQRARPVSVLSSTSAIPALHMLT